MLTQLKNLNVVLALTLLSAIATPNFALGADVVGISFHKSTLFNAKTGQSIDRCSVNNYGDVSKNSTLASVYPTVAEVTDFESFVADGEKKSKTLKLVVKNRATEIVPLKRSNIHVLVRFKSNASALDFQKKLQLMPLNQVYMFVDFSKAENGIDSFPRVKKEYLSGAKFEVTIPAQHILILDKATPRGCKLAPIETWASI